jgi:hypothetical protein
VTHNPEPVRHAMGLDECSEQAQEDSYPLGTRWIYQGFRDVHWIIGMHLM